ncbi:MAG: ABC transporter ATP-binding protein [Candidatus Woesearchaeota archaeon]
MVTRVKPLRAQSTVKSADSSAIISLRDVEKVYDLGEVQVKALRGVSVDVAPGEFITIIGKSGSGKSTLVNMIGCLDTPTSGAVYLDGRNIAELDESDLAQIRGRTIGFIFQTFNLMPTLSVAENVSIPMVFQGTDEEVREKRVRELLELVELSDRVSHKPAELSGGQRQRVAIARALANDPKVILADEPTGNLDSKTGKQIMQALLLLNEQQDTTLILVTHDDDLAQLAPRTVVLVDGTVGEIRTRSASEVKKNRKAFFGE